MRKKIIFALAILGMLIGLFSAYYYGIRTKPLPPAFNPAINPFEHGIYATGIVESLQGHGSNIDIFPEVPGTVTNILVNEGDRVAKGTPLLTLDDSVQRATVEQQRAQAEAALSLLQQLKAQPRLENLRVSKAQMDYAAASLKTARDTLAKTKKSYELNPKSVSKDQLDTAENTYQTAKANLEVATRQYQLTKAGAWIYDIRNQQHQYQALVKAYESGKALLAKYVLKAPVDGVILAINTAKGNFASSAGSYDTYTQGFEPTIVMGLPQDFMAVRAYIDEILIPRMLPLPNSKAQMQVRGTDVRIPLEFDRIQPYVIPKIELSNQRTERVDVRVLSVVFRFKRPKDLNIYPGMLVDIYVESK
uniref:Biotin/lipoyl-binding protein n=1 Tax=Desulfobacca acetoxidans TaxID=60893 RepID=A0A7V6A0V9_9BACT